MANPIFKTIRSSSNLVTPDIDTFLSYLKRSYDANFFRANGPATKELEERLVKIHGVDYCITFPNCFSSIICCLSSLSLREGSEVITPSFTYRRFGDIISWLGLVPHYCEVDEITLTPTVEMVGSCINENTSAVLLVQPMILITDFTSHHTLTREHGFPLIIDSVEATHSTLNGQKVGSFGDAECFSMHASKLFNACDGGYVTTSNSELAEKLRELRSSIGMELNEIHAAMALASIDIVSEQIKRNKERYFLYRNILKDISGITLIEYDLDEPRGFKNIMVRLEDDWPLSREETIDLMHAENILARPFWSPPLHLEKPKYKIINGDLPVTEKVGKNHMLLPCGEFTSLHDIKKICDFIDSLQKEATPCWNSVEKAFRGIFERRWWTSHGPLMKELEKKLEDTLNVNNAICVSSESWALMIVSRALLLKDTFPHTSLTSKSIKALQQHVEIYTIEEWRKINRSDVFCVIVNLAGGISCICTNDDNLAERVRCTRTVPGRRKKVDVYATGNGRMSEAQATIVLLSLKKRDF